MPNNLNSDLITFRKPVFAGLLVCGLCMTALPSAAQSSLYGNLGISQLSADLDLTDLSVEGTTIDLGQQDADITMITGRLGYRIMDFIAIEGEAGFGLGGDGFEQNIPVNVSGVGNVNIDTDVDVDISNYGALFVRGILPVSERFDLFSRAGYGYAKAEVKAVGTVANIPGATASASESDSVDDFAFGVGAQYNFDARHGLRLDYASINDFDVITASYAINF